MYEELIVGLRNCAKLNSLSFYKRDLMAQAADAIEKLNNFNLMWQEAAKIALEEVPKWISVTERLPEIGQHVLAWLKWEDCEILEWRMVNGAKYWQAEWGAYDSSDITHWMPLPEPPEEEADGTT